MSSTYNRRATNLPHKDDRRKRVCVRANTSPGRRPPLVTMPDNFSSAQVPLPSSVYRTKGSYPPPYEQPKLGAEVSPLTPDAAQAQMLEADNTTCGLLELPPELRNAIYHLALGDEVIHIHCDPGPGQHNNKLRTRLCVATVSDEQVLSTLRDAPGQVSKVKTHAHRHAVCEVVGSPGSSYSVALLLTCRQIHHEAKLLPFALNTFSFDRDVDIKAFVNSFGYDVSAWEQTKAIKSIVLGEEIRRGIKNHRILFKGLEQITLFVCSPAASDRYEWSRFIEACVYLTTGSSRDCFEDDIPLKYILPFDVDIAKLKKICVCARALPAVYVRPNTPVPPR